MEHDCEEGVAEGERGHEEGAEGGCEEKLLREGKEGVEEGVTAVVPGEVGVGGEVGDVD